MPEISEFVTPEVFLQHNGVVIFHTYRDGLQDQGANGYWFTTNNQDWECEEHFDVRELPTWEGEYLPPFLDSSSKDKETEALKDLWWDQWRAQGVQEYCITEAIKAALDQGLIEIHEDNHEYLEPDLPEATPEIEKARVRIPRHSTLLAIMRHKTDNGLWFDLYLSEDKGESFKWLSGFIQRLTGHSYDSKREWLKRKGTQGLQGCAQDAVEQLGETLYGDKNALRLVLLR